MEQRILTLLILTPLLAACGGSPVTPVPTAAITTAVSPAPPTVVPTPDLLGGLLAVTAVPRPTRTLEQGTWVEVGGRRIYVTCSGEGSPAVVLEAGRGGGVRDWSMAQPGVADFTRVCSYDRAGLGSSDPGPRPRTSRAVAEDLHALLRAIDIEPPYVLVGHSFGGIHARVYADLYPGEVAGMVLVDASHPDQLAPQLDALPPPKRGESTELRQLRADLTSPQDTGPEGLDVRGSFDQARESGSLGGMPLAVLTARRVDPQPGILGSVVRRFDRSWRQLQAQLPRLSTDSVHVVAKDSGHFVQRENPELVVETIRQVVEAVRTGKPLPSCGQALERLGGECVR